MKILVVDDHALVREGLHQVLKGLDEQVEVLEAGHCERAFELAAAHPDLDLVLLDYHLPDMNGLQALGVFSARHPELPIVMLSGSVNPQIARQVLAQGAAGFISKANNSGELLDIVRQVLAGEIYAPPELLRLDDLAELGESQSVTGEPLLTTRQEDVLQLLLQGRSNKDISATLHLSDETTKNHVSGILRAFGVQTRIHAVLAAAHHGYIKASTSA